MLTIESLQNPKIKGAIKLQNRRERDLKDAFLIEGYRELVRASHCKWHLDELFFCPELFLGTNENALIEKIEAQGAHIFSCSERVFRKLSYRDRPDGLLAVAPQRHLGLEELSLDQPFYVVAEAIEKPGNLGTILRSADAVGANGCIVCDRCTDVYNPNVVRAGVGTLFSVPVVEVSSQEAISWLKENGVAIVAGTPSAEEEYTHVQMGGPIAIAVGTEQLGLSDAWMEQADIRVRIPMKGIADSLNVAMATTLLLYEVLRQRSHRV